MSIDSRESETTEEAIQRISAIDDLSERYDALRGELFAYGFNIPTPEDLIDLGIDVTNDLLMQMIKDDEKKYKDSGNLGKSYDALRAKVFEDREEKCFNKYINIGRDMIEYMRGKNVDVDFY